MTEASTRCGTRTAVTGTESATPNRAMASPGRATIEERGLQASGAGWDSEMVEYPWVFESNGKDYLLYNGNDYGSDGVGLAVWESAV